MKNRARVFVYAFLFIFSIICPLLTQSSLNITLRLGYVCPIVLFVMFFATLSRPQFHRDSKLMWSLGFFLIFAFYMIVIGIVHGTVSVMLPIILTVGSVFSFAFLGYDIRNYSFCTYIMAAFSAILLLDFSTGGLTAGWNTNSIGMMAITGVFMLFFSINLESQYLWGLKLGGVAALLALLWVTRCRSAMFGFILFLVIRYLFFLKPRRSFGGYMATTAVFLTMPYWLMRIYLALYNSPYRTAINTFFKEKTGKNLFTEREKIWNPIFSNDLRGWSFFFGKGVGHINAHNIMMDILYLLGWVGLILFLVFLYFVFRRLYRYQADPIIRTALAAFLGLWASQTFECAFFYFSSYTFNNVVYLFLAIAIGRHCYLSDLSQAAERKKL